ncbi:MAG: hypothetical protein ACQET8_19125 [Bacillota bacterium]
MKKYTREELYLKHLKSTLLFYRSLSRPFTIRDVGNTTGLSEERTLELLEKL